jgi:hypothetical protein
MSPTVESNAELVKVDSYHYSVAEHSPPHQESQSQPSRRLSLNVVHQEPSPLKCSTTGRRGSSSSKRPNNHENNYDIEKEGNSRGVGNETRPLSLSQKEGYSYSSLKNKKMDDEETETETGGYSYGGGGGKVNKGRVAMEY